ncbi:putative quinate O-hydroxycinnamoyltransferase [Lupinus albus]|uniref:Putative quinate O-hydroxycinnamoyltransferase n=1 Tax=Lupinus albus TaxID=3870 RepID=A0A6A4PV97_LUPAL|nr:putative quinate O-hydroxycinnamoyltransferase [Lupinus albus]
MAVVDIISTSFIQAESDVYGDPSSPKIIHVTPWDLTYIAFETNRKGLLFNNPINIEPQIQHLKQSLSSTLAFFPPLAGRLVILQHDEDNTVSSHILCNNEGALFVHAVVSDQICVSDILQSNYVPPFLHSFFPLTGVKNYDGTSQPLLAVQITELVDGIFIGISMNHVVADGKSLWHFINSWAEISRGCEVVSKLPSLERWFLHPNRCPIRFPFNEEDQMENSEDCTYYQRIFHFTKEKIAEIKSKANAEAGTNKISSLQALLTHLWRTVIHNQQLDPEKECIYVFMIDVRGRIVPPLPDNYFGNALAFGIIGMKGGELLLEGGLGKGALEMHKMITSYSDEKLKILYESWVRPPNMYSSGRLSNMLATSSSPRFNVYGNDFGWGKPLAVRTDNSMNGITTLFAGAEEGSIDLTVCLPYEVLEAMGNDPHFMDPFSI